MKNQIPVERHIREALKQASHEINATTQLKERIDTELIQFQKKENSFMKKLTVKKLVVLAAAVCVLGSTAVYAAGKITGITSSSSHNNDVTDFARLPEAEKQLGVPIRTVEKFTNGFAFSLWNVGDRERMDEQNNVVSKSKFLTLIYKNAENKDIFLSAEPVFSTEEAKNDTIYDYNGTTLRYSTFINKAVPSDYQLTEEDKINSQRDDYSISYGTSTVEELVIQNVSWICGDTFYQLMDMNQSVDEEGLIAMAKEIVDAN